MCPSLWLHCVLLANPVLARAPVIGPGREAEVQALFRSVGTDATSGWRVTDLLISQTEIQASLVGPDGATLGLALVHPSQADSRLETPSFRVLLRNSSGLPGSQLQAILERLAGQVAQVDRGDFWLDSALQNAERGRPPPRESSRWTAWEIGNLSWSAWMLLWAGVILAVLFRLRPWASREGRAVLLDLLWLVALAWVLRDLIAPAGPGNLYSRVPVPPFPNSDLPFFGPGFHAWLMPWFYLMGPSDDLIFSLGAVMGSLAIVPVYLLTRTLSGSRVASLAASLLLATWPVHLFLSPTDDSTVLVATFIATGLVFLWQAQARAARLMLLGTWLSLSLAATTRPDAALAMLPVMALVFADPTLRRLQLSLPALLLTAALAAWVLACEWATLVEATSTFARTGASRPVDLLKLFGSEHASIFYPPYSLWAVVALALGGLAVSWRRGGGYRLTLSLLASLLPALATLKMLGEDPVTKRYQLSVIPLAACSAGLAIGWLSDQLSRRVPGRSWAGWALAAIVVAGLGSWGVLAPVDEPTYRLEYRFFRAHLASVPQGCRIVRPVFDEDLGLNSPEHLSAFLGLSHRWIRPEELSEPSTGCLAYWRPASCHASSPKQINAHLPPPFEAQCAELDHQREWKPLAITELPARRGFCETYSRDPVPLGFYLASPSGPAESPAVVPGGRP